MNELLKEHKAPKRAIFQHCRYYKVIYFQVGNPNMHDVVHLLGIINLFQVKGFLLRIKQIETLNQAMTGRAF